MSKSKGFLSRPRLSVGLSVLVVAVIGLVGCGGGSSTPSESTTTAVPNEPVPKPAAKPVTDKQHLPSVDLTVTSPAMKKPKKEGASVLSKAYVCKGGSFPPVRWKGVPPNAKEVVVLIMNLVPVQGKIYFDGAVAGLDPKAGELPSGKLPAGAVVGENSQGKSAFFLCPKKANEEFVLAVLAPEKSLDPGSGFHAATIREEAYEASDHMGLAGFVTE
jgi:phosphatidylethanolamine-binding protein (PEBP) family uncharacterized protein